MQIKSNIMYIYVHIIYRNYNIYYNIIVYVHYIQDMTYCICMQAVALALAPSFFLDVFRFAPRSDGSLAYEGSWSCKKPALKVFHDLCKEGMESNEYFKLNGWTIWEFSRIPAYACAEIMGWIDSGLWMLLDLGVIGSKHPSRIFVKGSISNNKTKVCSSDLLLYLVVLHA